MLAALAAVLVTAPASVGASSPTAGVVVVNARLAYGGGGSTGTGIVLASNGQVLTNNHVIRGAGSIRVTVPSSGRKYSATVAGYSVSKDVALLTLDSAQGLATAKVGDSETVDVGDRVLTVGNAGGGGLTTKTGKVTGLRQSVTVGDSGFPLTLVGLIETTVPLEPGDSGGPMLVKERVIGVDTIASGGVYDRASTQGYAIPINVAVKIAGQIEAGRSSSTVHIGPTAFLGVSLARSGFPGVDAEGALVERVVAGSPAARAGIGVNDVITSFGGKRVTSAGALRRLVLQSSPGRTVKVTWLDPRRGKTSATVRLVEGPPQ